MKNKMGRRDFLKVAPTAAWVLTQAARGATLQPSSPTSRILLETFDYRGVRLLESPWQKQYQAARDFYFSIPDDDILKGFRESAGLPAPGSHLGGWARRGTGGIFGQWLSGMARMYRATGDTGMRDKAVRLVTEYAKTVKPDGGRGQGHYGFDKLVCGLVDLQSYAEFPDAIGLLEKVTESAIKTFDRKNEAATVDQFSGRPGEWYTLAENLYRAYSLTKNPKFKTFAEVWLYPQYWNKFADTADPSDAHGVHAYSHVNTFSSAAMAYAVSGDPAYLRIIKNAYDFLQNRQCYATGGFGPVEHLVPSDGSLGKSLEYRPDEFETGCGTWAGFKLSRYLMQFTGEARYGDWAERLMYNGIGAALPITTGGKNFYYSDYRLAGGMKIYRAENYTCCSGTYIQDVVDYHNLIYYRDRSSLYVNMYVPSEAIWSRPEGEIKIRQETLYPEGETSTLTLQMKQAVSFPLKFRVPGWARDASVKVNGTAAGVTCAPGTWATVERIWSSGDKVEIRIPLRFRMEAIDPQHPDRVAVMRGPVVMVLDAWAHSQRFRLPESEDDLNTWMISDPKPTRVGLVSPAESYSTPGVFRVQFPDGTSAESKMFPFYAMGEVFPYKMYFDKKSLPFKVW